MKKYCLFLSVTLLLSTQTHALRGKIYLNDSFKKILYLAEEQFMRNGYESFDVDMDPWFQGQMNSCKSTTAEGALLNFRNFIRYNLIRTHKSDQVLNHFFKMESNYWICNKFWSHDGDFHTATKRFFLGKKGNIRFAITTSYID